MQLLLGLFFFSILLTTGGSLKCVHCVAVNGYCSDVKEECPSGDHVCMDITLRNKINNKYDAIVKTCSTQSDCKQLEKKIGKELATDSVDGISFETVIQRVVCSRAPPSFAPFFPAFLGLLLMKLVF